MLASTPAGFSRNLDRWIEAWPDVLAFVGGLAVAWFAGWNTTDLVWSLWLASLVVGYAMIVWMIFSRAIGSAGLFAAGLLLLAFFTIHFGLFHFVHSVFLGGFFPVGERGAGVFFNLAMYGEVFQRYWWFLPVAALAERTHFRLPPPAANAQAAMQAYADKRNNALLAPYKNVVRLHLLIFFFAAVHFVGIENFFVYAVVYAVYFFPWRLLRRRGRAVGG